MADGKREAKSARQPPVRIPLPFDVAVSGLLQVDPKSPIARTKSPKKKPRPKK